MKKHATCALLATGVCTYPVYINLENSPWHVMHKCRKQITGIRKETAK